MIARDPFVGKMKSPQAARELKLFIDGISAGCAEFAGKCGARVCLIPFHQSADRVFTEQTASKIPGAKIESWTTLDQLLDIFSSLDIVLTARFHGLVLASNAGIPHAAVAVDPKIEYFQQNYRYSGISRVLKPEECTAERVAAVLTETWQNQKLFADRAADQTRYETAAAR